MSWRMLALCLASLALSGCAFADGWSPQDGGIRAVCTSDEQCDGNRVCFVDGCGDPGTSIVVEISPNNRAGQHAQDFAIDRLGPAQDFVLRPTTLLRGLVEQERPDDGSGSVEAGPYAGRISVRLSGESALVPGLPRSFELTTTLQAGEFTLPVASGQYAITVTPEEPAIPPSLLHGVMVPAGFEQSATFTLPAAEALARLEGRILSGGRPIPGATFAVQAFEAFSQRPLSQLTQSDPLTGAFELGLLRTALVSLIRLRVSPLQTDSILPAQTFELLAMEGESMDLDLGAFGLPATLGGRLMDRRGQPVPGATVYVEGFTESEGTFRSPTVRSDNAGRFQLLSLPTGSFRPATLWVIPPPRARSTLLILPVEIPYPSSNLGDLILDDRTPVTAMVRRPEGGPAENVVVVAEPVDRLANAPLPSSSAETVTTGDGRLLLHLDPGTYRLDLNPGAPLPRISRFIEVPPPFLDAEGMAVPQELEVLTLSRGRVVNGLIQATDGAAILGPIPQATVRYFRVVDDAGGPSHVLLAEGTTDEEGNYVVTLPTR